MKRKMLARVAKVLVIIACGLFGCAYLVPTTSTANAGSSRLGPAEIYRASCATCHGSNGKARTAKGKRTGATDFTSDWNTDPDRGFRIISNGKSEMPAFKGKLKPSEIRGVFNYVLRFRR